MADYPTLDTPLGRADQVLVNAAIALVSARHADSWRPVLLDAMGKALPRVTRHHPMVTPLAEAAGVYLKHAQTPSASEAIRARGDMDDALVQLACWRLGHLLDGDANG